MSATRVYNEDTIRTPVYPDAIFLLPLRVHPQAVVRQISDLENGGRFEKSARKDLLFFDNVLVGKDSLIRGDRGADVFRGNNWWVLHGNDRLRAQAAEGGKAMYFDPILLLWKGGIF